jgi:hypothetical protein
MRDPINVFYYPDFYLDYVSLVKAILLFDELHFMDRPSIMFGVGPEGQFGTIGADSPLRQFEQSFREEGVPLFVHPAPMGPIGGKWYESVKADVNDLEFLRRFQSGLKTSPTFCRLQIAPGDYGPSGNQDDVAKGMVSVDLSADLSGYESPIELFEDSRIRPFDLSNTVGCAKQLLSDAAICSAKLNFALSVATNKGFVPLSDAKPYGDLLGAKYARAIRSLTPARNSIQISDLSFAVFDALLPNDKIRALKMTDVVRYRKESEKAREAFLEHLTALQAKQASIGIDGDYAGAVRKVVETDIIPAARTFKNKLDSVYETLFGSLAKGALGFLGSSSALSLFGDLSWNRLLGLAGGTAAYVVKGTIDAILAERTVKRECSISYVLSLDD